MRGISWLAEKLLAYQEGLFSVELVFSCHTFLGAFAKLWKATISFVLSVCLSVYPSAWNNSAPAGRIVMKCNHLSIFQKPLEKMQVSLKCDGNNVYFTWRTIYFVDHVSLNYSQNEKCFRQICRANEDTHFILNNFFPPKIVPFARECGKVL